MGPFEIAGPRGLKPVSFCAAFLYGLKPVPFIVRPRDIVRPKEEITGKMRAEKQERERIEREGVAGNG